MGWLTDWLVGIGNKFNTVKNTVENYFQYVSDKANEQYPVNVNPIQYGYEVDGDGNPVPGSGYNDINTDLIDSLIPGDTGATENYHTDLGIDNNDQIDYSMPSDDGDIPIVGGNDAKTFADLKGMSVEDKLEWLIENDPDNRTSWIEQLLGVQTARENTTDARAYSLQLENSSIQRAAKDLEAAGINPLLAYQYFSGSGRNLSVADLPASYASRNETERGVNSEDNLYGLGKGVLGVLGLLIASLIRKKR